MNQQQWMNLFLFIGILLASYFLFRYFDVYENTLGYKEGLDNMETTGPNASNNGIAGNAANYAININTENVKMQDIFLISKYRTDYEKIILNLDDYTHNLMLQMVLKINKDDPSADLIKLGQLSNARAALNETLKFIDKK